MKLLKLRNHVEWTTFGVAKTGEPSPLGVAAQGEHWDGRLDAHSRLPTIRIKLRDAFNQAGVKWKTLDSQHGPIVVPVDYEPSSTLGKVLHGDHVR